MTQSLTALSESDFAQTVDDLAARPDTRADLVDLLREDHDIYQERGSATIVRMRGWILLALGRCGVTDETLPFVLEELDTGTDPYLVAAAARSLRSYPHRLSPFAAFALRAIRNIRYRDEWVCFDGYGEYATMATGTSPVRELLRVLVWLGPFAVDSLDEIEALRTPGGLPTKLFPNVDDAIQAVRRGHESCLVESDCCGLLNTLGRTFFRVPNRRTCDSLESLMFEDQDGVSLSFREMFCGHPTIVVFFYTRCDNPLKCSLTITKLARVQKLLEMQGASEGVHTAAITYDPMFDVPDRLRKYGESRGVRMNSRHRMLRAENIDAVRRFFSLGVNFIESLVNRHRLEVHVLDRRGHIAASFQRIHWDEPAVVNCAVELLSEVHGDTSLQITEQSSPPARHRVAAPLLVALTTLATAFFPKCAICWGAYLSVFGIAWLNYIPYSPWLQPFFAAMVVVNLASVWLRGRATGRMAGFYLVTAGIALLGLANVAAISTGALLSSGVGLVLVGSMLGTLGPDVFFAKTRPDGGRLRDEGIASAHAQWR